MILRGGVKTVPIITGGYNKKSQRGGPVYFNELWMPHTNAFFYTDTPSSAFSPVYTYVDDKKETILMKVQTNVNSLTGLTLAPDYMVKIGSSYPLAPQCIGRDGLHPIVTQKKDGGFEKINVGAWPDFTNMYMYAYNSVATSLEYLGSFNINTTGHGGPYLTPMYYRSPYDLNNALGIGIELRFWDVDQSFYSEFENAFQSCYNNYSNPDKAVMEYYVTATNNYAAYNNTQVAGVSLTAQMFSDLTGLQCNSLT